MKFVRVNHCHSLAFLDLLHEPSKTIMPFEKELIPYLLLNFISFMDHLATERLSSMLLITIYQKPFYKQKGMLGNVNIYCILFETTEQRLSTLPLQLILDAWASPSFFLFFLFLSLLVQIVLWTFMRNVISSNSSPSPLIQLLPKRQQEFLQREPASFSPTPLPLPFPLILLSFCCPFLLAACHLATVSAVLLGSESSLAAFTQQTN